MQINGAYRDILKCSGREIEDFGWRHNDIAKDFGRFLAALMKKDFNKLAGIDYLAVGGGSGGYDEFKEGVKSFFNSANSDPKVLDRPFTPQSKSYWVWAKKIVETEDKIKYLGEDGNETDAITNKILVHISLKEGVPPHDTPLEFKEFALLGIGLVGDKFDVDKMFFVDYVNHPTITKDKNTQLIRDIKLTFP